MISWIQTTFQKHTKLFLLFLLLVVAVPFVFTIGAAPGIGKAGNKILTRPFFGYNLGSDEDQKRIFGDAEMSIYLQAGFMALGGAQLQDYALQRVAALHLADINGVPQPTPKELTDHLATLRAFHNESGNFDARRYADFTDSLRNNPQLTKTDVARVLADDVRLAHMQSILSGPGYVLAPEVRSQLVRAGTEWTVAVATVDLAAFTPEIPVGELGLAAYFEDNVLRYQTPPRISVDYVLFQPSAYAAATSFTETELLEFYKANPARFPTETPGADATAFPDSIPAAVRPAVEAALRTELGAKRAGRAASDFAFTLFDRQIARDSAGLDDTIRSFNVTRQKALPFAATETPQGLAWPATVAQEAFKLNEQRWFSDPLPVANGALAVLFWNETLPARTPTLAEVRDAVVRDFTATERRKRFVEAGSGWRSQIESKVAGGMTLEAAAASLAQPKFNVTTYPAFTRRQPPQGIEPAALSALEQTLPGGVSGFIPTAEKGILVHVVSRKEPDVSESSPEFISTREQLARMTAGLSQNLVLSELVERELSRTAAIDR